MGTRDVVVVRKHDHPLGYVYFATGAELRRVVVPKFPQEFANSGRIQTPPVPVRIARGGLSPQVLA